MLRLGIRDFVVLVLYGAIIGALMAAAITQRTGQDWLPLFNFHAAHGTKPSVPRTTTTIGFGRRMAGFGARSLDTARGHALTSHVQQNAQNTATISRFRRSARVRGAGADCRAGA
jgi:hypothetical protein